MIKRLRTKYIHSLWINQSFAIMEDRANLQNILRLFNG